jgi:hypothetical protein
MVFEGGRRIFTEGAQEMQKESWGRVSCSGGYNFNMTQEWHELLQKALALSESERAELVGNLLSSLELTLDENVDEAWQQEVARRLHEGFGLEEAPS